MKPKCDPILQKLNFSSTQSSCILSNIIKGFTWQLMSFITRRLFVLCCITITVTLDIKLIYFTSLFSCSTKFISPKQNNLHKLLPPKNLQHLSNPLLPKIWAYPTHFSSVPNPDKNSELFLIQWYQNFPPFYHIIKAFPRKHSHTIYMQQ